MMLLRESYPNLAQINIVNKNPHAPHFKTFWQIITLVVSLIVILVNLQLRSLLCNENSFCGRVFVGWG